MVRWVHTDPNLGVSAREGLERALAQDWQSGGEADRVRALRALLAADAWAIGVMAGTVTVVDEDGAGLLAVTTQLSAPGERGRVARTLYRTWAIVADGQLAEGEVVTEAAAIEVGFAPLLAATVIIVGLAETAAIGYVAHQAAQVIDRALARRESTARLVEQNAQVTKLVAEHNDREAKAGKPLPLSAATLKALDIVEHTQKEIVTAEPALSSGIPEFDVGASAGVLALLVAVGVAFVATQAAE